MSRDHPTGARAVWLLPAVGVLLTWSTLDHQPDPVRDLPGWARYVTTGAFELEHLVGSILGQALFLLAVLAVTGVVACSGRSSRTLVLGVTATVLGSSGLLAGFGVAAFAQPVVGHLVLRSPAEVGRAAYDSLYSPELVALLVGSALLYAISSVLVAVALRGFVARWVRVAYGLSGPLIGLVGLIVGPAQTVGAALLTLSGAALARGLARGPAAGRTPRTGPGDVPGTSRGSRRAAAR